MPAARLRQLTTACLLASLVWVSAYATAAVAEQDPAASPLLRTKIYLQVAPDGRDELTELLDALEASVIADEEQGQPVVILLQGPEALPFLRRNYPANRALVNRAAALEAFGRVELRMCESWMIEHGYRQADLLPFVGTVPGVPDEVRRLERDGYVSYPAVTL